MSGLRDHERPTLPNDLHRLLEDHLDLPRVALVAGELPRLLRRHDSLEADDLTLDLRDRLLGDDDDVAVLDRRELRDHRRKIIAFPNLGQAVHGNDLDHAWSGTPVTRTPECAL